MQIGVIIERGLKDWQIIQQHGGIGSLQLSGRYIINEEQDTIHVWARLVYENTGEPVFFWREAEMKENQEWSIVLNDIPVGGLYRIETCLKEDQCPYFADALRGDIIHHVGVGDLYVIAGQSNSSGYGKDFICDPPDIGVHIYKNSEQWDLASHPLNDSTNTLHLVNREYIMSAHSPYLSFAKYLKGILGYPIGLLQASLGGSPIERWNPRENGDLYRNMLNIIKQQGGAVAGILWYQGCTEACEENHENYFSRFKEMVTGLRAELGDEVPFYTAQLNRLTEKSNEKKDYAWSCIREAQRQAAKNLNKVYMIPTIDGTLSDLIHNSAAFNMVLGERFAKMALVKNYGKRFCCDAPDLKEAVLEKCTLVLSFYNVVDILDSYSVSPDELMLQIMDENGRVNITDYKINSNQIILKLERAVVGTCYVSNAIGQDPKGKCMIDFSTHLPVVSFLDERVKII